VKHLSHAIGFDDSPFAPAHRGDVLVVGAVHSGARLDGVLTARVRRDGANAARVLGELANRSRFREHLQVVMLQGIALAGFNVVDIRGLHEAVHLPVLVVTRRPPDLEAIRRALLGRVPGGARKWKLIERAGPMEPMGGVYVQRAGLTAPRGPGGSRPLRDPQRGTGAAAHRAPDRRRPRLRREPPPSRLNQPRRAPLGRPPAAAR
jgi:endonuclease V-like protein UPF0215 family